MVVWIFFRNGIGLFGLVLNVLNCLIVVVMILVGMVLKNWL